MEADGLCGAWRGERVGEVGGWGCVGGRTGYQGRLRRSSIAGFSWPAAPEPNKNQNQEESFCRRTGVVVVATIQLGSSFFVNWMSSRCQSIDYHDEKQKL